jgi:heptosyltransferase-2
MIDRVLSIDSNYLELLLAEHFDLAIGPDADPLSASIMALTTSDSKCGYVADGRGSVTPLNEAALAWWRMGLDDTLKQSNRRTYGEWLYAICDLPTPVARPCFHVPQKSTDDAMSRLRAQAPTVNRWACFNTGASARWEEKRWKPLYYQQLARMVAQEMPGLGVVLIGGPEDEALHRELLLSHPGLIDGGTYNSIEQFAALLAVSQWVLTADSLGYHLACAIGTPAFCLVGPTSPWELDTYGQNAILHAPLDCVACYRPRCPLATTCMDLLTPAVVWRALAQWSAQLPPSRRPEA